LINILAKAHTIPDLAHLFRYSLCGVLVAGVEWKSKLPEWGNSTPVIWGDAIFLTSHEDDRLTENQLDDETFASPVASHGKLFIRTRKSLYCLSK